MPTPYDAIVAALSYLLLPITGLLALTLGSTPRVRFHGLQSIVFGLAWALALYGGAAAAPAATKLVFALGALVWLALMLATAAGKDPRLPGIGPVLRRATEEDL